MKILLINNFYYNRGGDCTYLFSLKNLLKENGHKVSIFSMQHPKNFESDCSKYFVSYINYDEEVKSKSLSSGLKVAKRTIYSTEARNKIEELIKAEKPDIAHIQNIHHHITPSIFGILKKYNIPIIWTLHDYTIVCPNTSFLSHGKVCEKCKRRKYFWPLIVRCKKNSFAASTMAALETTIHVVFGFNKLVDFFIAPSNFLKEKLMEYGVNEEKIIRLNNFTCFVDLSNEKPNIENYFMYLGRLSEEKGIKTLIDAAMKVLLNGDNDTGRFNDYKLKIVGDGPLKEEMISYVKLKGAENNIEFLGHKSHEEAMNILKGSKFLVIPSQWYENFPYTVLESFTLGKPVIASRIGGIPELVKNWETGLLVDPGNSELLSLKISFLLKHPEKAEAIGKNAGEFMSGEINSENHYLKLMEVYRQALGMNSSK
ncbi:MAG TPA: glycosyltransferase family 1 protein [Nitrospirae bacterium]|nr:alpha-D-kanosaminyltransferase [bacterium BMS3Abin06]HDH13266.1 glycosyltransferase family 1 protein [Nitrospirota bacterium]HDZ01766.1 glycosyltransferase family 1 protein [Nitrospirota bacterium]